MDTALLRHEIDEDLVAHLGPEDEAFGLRAQVLAPAELPALALPAATLRLLLVVFRLPEPAPEPPPTGDLGPGGPVTPPPSWHLGYVRTDARGQPLVRRIPLILPTAQGPAAWKPRGHQPPRAPVSGMVYRGAWWVDLSALAQAGELRPGLPLRVDYRQQAQADVVMR